MSVKLLSLNQYGHRRPGRLASQPTQALPGTLDKLNILAARAANGESLFHPEDREGVAPRLPINGREGRLAGQRVEIW
jgi:hypothetical protein